ncbi:MAG TPA: GNAT family N-acetyltransferase [Rubrivivax sp.]|nr:GNAT family N-acetyltransferase [Rubrivivax sp.]
MSTRHLEALLQPASVVVVGASARPGSLGETAWRNLRAGPFKGAVFAVNPKYRRLDGQSVYARVAELPAPADLALICTPAPTVPALVAELGAHGTRAAIVLSSGLDADQRQAMLDAARPHLLRVLGPGSIGLLSPQLGLNASIAHTDALAGELAFVSQSGSLCRAMLDVARARAIGFSHVVSLGEHADVDAGDLLDQLASDGRTRSILLYLDAIQSPRKFLSAARAAARNKPVIVLRSPRAVPGEPVDEAADRVYDGAIRSAGMLRVGTLPQMFLAAETLARFRSNRSEQLAVLSNGAGAGALAADAAAREGVPLCTLADATLQRLQPLLARAPAQAAPLLLRADAPPAAYEQALQLLAQDPAAPALLVVHAPNAVVPSVQVARALLPLGQQQPPRLLGCWLGQEAVAEARREFLQAGITSCATPDEAVGAFAMLVTYRRNQAQLIEAPPSRSSEIRADAAAARALVQRVLGSGRTQLEPDEARTLLAAYGIGVLAMRQVEAEPYAAASAAESIGYPVSLQLLSPELPDGPDRGTQRLDLRSAVQVRDAAQRLLNAQRSTRTRVDGLRVMAAAWPAHARVLSLGARIDPLFGPVILLGIGGAPSDDGPGPSAALPPLNLPLARALMHRSGVMALLRRHRAAPPADDAALQRVLVGLSQLLSDVSQIAEVELSPLLAGSDGVLAWRAHVRLSLAAPAGALNFAIRPYPSNLVETLDWHGRRLALRPIRPEDEAQHMAFLNRLDPADIRMRLFYARRSIERSELARLTQIDYAREMAFVAVEADDDGVEQTLGVVRAIADPDNINAEFGIVVRSDLKGARLGELLMRRIIDYQRGHGTKKLVATVLTENKRMLELARQLGFTESASDEGAGVRWIELALQR